MRFCDFWELFDTIVPSHKGDLDTSESWDLETRRFEVNFSYLSLINGRT